MSRGCREHGREHDIPHWAWHNVTEQIDHARERQLRCIVSMTRRNTTTNFTATANFGNGLPQGTEILAKKVAESEYANAALTVTAAEITIDLGTDKPEAAVLRMVAFSGWAAGNHSPKPGLQQPQTRGPRPARKRRAGICHAWPATSWSGRCDPAREVARGRRRGPVTARCGNLWHWRGGASRAPLPACGTTPPFERPKPFRRFAA